MKQKALIIFKTELYWNKFLINKFLKFYHVEYLYLSKLTKNYLETIKEINKFIDKNNIEIVFFDVDYQKFVNLFFIKKIKNIKKIMLTFDDYERHELNTITADGCDLVLSACPISTLKYKEVGYKAFFMPLESDGKFYTNKIIKKEIDALFFGKINEDRKKFINFIQKNEVNVCVVGNNENNRVSDEELVNLICKSKIVINFSKSTWKTVKSIPEGEIFKFNYQFKGRIIQAGLCGTLCVSEYAPHHSLLFNSNELLEFNSKEECVNILQNLLKDDEKLVSLTNKFVSKIKNFYEDEKFFNKIFNAINNISNVRKNNLKKVPFWYLRIAAKQTVIRDARILSLPSTFLQLIEVIKIIKMSKIYVKFLILGETIINMLWYSILRSFKPKGVGKNRYIDKL